jgi:hypothetical protein
MASNNKTNKTPNDQNAKRPVAESGNASNPSPDEEQQNDNQLLNKKAEKYLREGGNIEDMPDAQEEEEAEDELRSGEGGKK